ncbi:MAG TPA: OmpA family protein [Terriglobia bacterium]|nr:OmpA family protein [Terriglobia bacterium]
MQRTNNQYSNLGFVILAAILVVPGCASKKYVRDQVGALQPAITEASNAGKENAERIDAVDRRAQQGITAATSAATAADQKATQAGQAAQTAQQAAQAADRKADTANTAVATTNNRVTTVENRINSLNDNYTAGEAQTVTFKTNSAELSDGAKGTLDTVANDVTGMRTGFMIEVQGFTDGQGPDAYNVILSQRRADTVLRYLVGKGVPLYRVSIVGLGKANPVADNKTRSGRDQNRRVEIRILRATSGRSTND